MENVKNAKSVYNIWEEAFYLLLFFFIVGIVLVLYLLIDHKL